jgi:hypothetical protein
MATQVLAWGLWDKDELDQVDSSIGMLLLIATKSQMIGLRSSMVELVC